VAKVIRLSYEDGTIRFLNVEQVVMVEKDTDGKFRVYTAINYGVNDLPIPHTLVLNESNAREVLAALGESNATF
jgi:hypothetical protein